MPEHTQQQAIARALRQLEAGQYVAEDTRKQPLRICEQQPSQDGLVHAVSRQGTVYAFEDAPSGVRIHRGSSIEEDVADMDSDGFIDSLDVEERGEHLITPLPHEVPSVEHLSSYRQPALIEGWAVGHVWVSYRSDDLKFRPLPFEKSTFQMRLENDTLFVGDEPLSQKGERLSLIVDRL